MEKNEHVWLEEYKLSDTVICISGDEIVQSKEGRDEILNKIMRLYIGQCKEKNDRHSVK